MKRYYKICRVALLCPLLSLTMPAAFAQDKPIPLDADVKTGKLSNGFTYYISHHAQPQNRVELYLVNKVGSILEDDDQLGLAHFMEHMNFNGTKHYPKNQLVDYLQKVGVQFGADLNAYTAFDETVYQLPLSSKDPGVFSSALQIMRDWAQDATLDPVEIENERGVILEEERLGKGARDRMSRQTLPVLLNHSRYANRLPIGNDEILNTFSPDVIKRFHHDWYRPDLQALIIVGDIDVAETEARVRQLFGDLKNPANERERPQYRVPLTDGRQFVAVTDREQTNISIEVMFKKPARPLNSESAYLEMLTKNTLVQLLANRQTAEVSKMTDPAFLSASTSVQNAFSQFNVLDFSLNPKSGRTEEAFQQAWTILEKARRFGFTQTELDLVKKAMLRSLAGMMREADKIPSSVLVRQYMNHFLYDEAAPGLAWEDRFVREHLDKITLKDVSAMLQAYLDAKDVDMVVAGPDKDKAALPTQNIIDGWMATATKQQLSPFVDETAATALMTAKPKGGAVIKKEEVKSIGVTLLTLSNGVKVALKPTSFQNDQIVYSAFCPGGASLYQHADYDMALMAPQFINQMGVSSFNPVQLSKMLSDKNVKSSFSVGEDATYVNGGSSLGDLETALQLTYLQFTAPRADSVIFNKHLNATKELLSKKGVVPDEVFNDTLGYVTGGYNYRYAPMTAERMNKFNLKQTSAIYHQLLADAAGYTFVFVGNFNVAQITPLLAQYLGALPATNKPHQAIDNGVHTPEGDITKKVFKGTEDKASVRIMLHGNYTYSPTENLEIKALGEVLQLRMLESLREKEGEVYTPSVQAVYRKSPRNHYAFMIAFGCAPRNVDHLVQLVEQELKNLRENGIKPEELQKVKASYQKSHELSLKENGFWLKYITGQLQDKESLLQVEHTDEQLNKLNVDALKMAAQRYLSGKNIIRFELLPETTTKP